MLARQADGWTYNPRLPGSGYRNTQTGLFMSRADIRGLSDKIVTEYQGRTDGLANQVAEQQITADAWQADMRRQIKKAYTQQYLLGIGGRSLMTPADWGSVGGMLADQYRFLDGFADEVATGALSAEAIAARARMYINSSGEAFSRAQLRAHIRDQRANEKLWNLRARSEHCDDCVALNALGWIPIEQEHRAPSTGQVATPGGGQTICKTNCTCRYMFRQRG
jgi:hypothetical protein